MLITTQMLDQMVDAAGVDPAARLRCVSDLARQLDELQLRAARHRAVLFYEAHEWGMTYAALAEIAHVNRSRACRLAADGRMWLLQEIAERAEQEVTDAQVQVR